MKHYVNPETRQVYAYEDDETRLPIPPEDIEAAPRPVMPIPPLPPVVPALPEDLEEAQAVLVAYNTVQAKYQAALEVHAEAQALYTTQMQAWQAAEDARLQRNSKRWVPAHLVAISDEDLAALRAQQAAQAAANAPVPQVVTRFQARAALDIAGHYDAVEAYMAQASTPRLVKFAWTDAQEFERASPTVAALAQVLGLTDAQVDALFVSAAGIKA